MDWRLKKTIQFMLFSSAVSFVFYYGLGTRTDSSASGQYEILPDENLPDTIPDLDRDLTIPDFDRPLTANLPDLGRSLTASNLGRGLRVMEQCVVREDATRLPQEVIDGVEKFVFFIGWPRSGHSLVASLMDAHPNMIVANVFSVFRTVMGNSDREVAQELFSGLHKRSVFDATVGRLKNPKGYSLYVEGSCQGSFTELKVIGVKSGEIATNTYDRSVPEYHEMYKKLTESLQIPIKVIHVVRNPYDMIATHVLFTKFDFEWKENTSLVTEDRKFDNSNSLEDGIDFVFEKTQNIQRMRDDPQLHLSVLEIHGADLIHHTRETIERLCLFLDIECPVDYLDACEKKVYAGVSKTRNLVKWTPNLHAKVEMLSRNYSFFKRYSFYSD